MTIEVWYKQQVLSARRYNTDSAARAMPMGIVTDGPTLRESDGHTRLAEFLRHGERPLVRLVLPNPATVARHRLIRDVILKEGGEVVAIPTNVLRSAEIDYRTIEVVHTRFSKHPIRADEQLIRADVQTPHWGRDHWGYRSIVEYTNRSTYFLSGYDRNERGLSYFLCELPARVHPTTVKEAYEALKPESVKVAEKLGRKIKRQGDMFFIRSKDYVPSLKAIRRHQQYIHQSNHVAEDVSWEGPLTYVRGTIQHMPSGRRPDHAPLNLGRQHWWLCVRNTVPTVR